MRQSTWKDLVDKWILVGNQRARSSTLLWPDFSFLPSFALSSPHHGSIPALMKLKPFPWCQLSDHHSRARPAGPRQSLGIWPGSGHYLPLNPSGMKTSPLFPPHLTILLEHKRSFHTYDTQRTANIIFLSLDCFSNHIFPSMLPYSLYLLYFFTFAIGTAIRKCYWGWFPFG